MDGPGLDADRCWGGARLRHVGGVAAGLTAGLAIATGSAGAHDWGSGATGNRTEAAEVLAGARVNGSAIAVPAAPGRRVAAAGSDAGLLPGVDGPAELALLALVGLLATVLAFGLLVIVAKLTYGVVTGTAGWLSRAASVLPLSEGQVRVAVVALVATGAIMGVGVEVQENTTSLWDSEEGAAGEANDLKDQGLKGDPVGSLDADAVLTGDTYSGAPYDRPSPDTDGDRLKDSWEERGTTPGGAPLPGADPDHKDLYVQINYGAGAEPYTDAEKRALVESWAEMPVDNPDGETGIRLHIVEGDRLETMPTVSTAEDIDRFYTRDLLGPRRCVYHQVVVGQVRMDDAVGVAGAPGYTSAVTDERVSFEASNTTRRVHVTNHELLHNVVGTLDGSTHTSQGWLVPAVHPGENYLSPAAEEVLDRRIEGSGYYQNQVCASGTATPDG
jgi:hypothetical protein